MTKSAGTKTLPMGPRFTDACLKAFERQFGGSEEISPQHLIGYAWWWARERGVSGWSKARLANEEGHMLQEPEVIASEMEEQKDG